MYYFGCYSCPTRMLSAVVMMDDIKVFYTFNQCYNLYVICVDGRWHCGWQGRLDEEDHGGWWHHDISLQFDSQVFYSSLLTSTLLHLDDVMNLEDVSNIEAVKHFIVPSIITAYHILALIAEHTNWSDTSWCHHLQWSPSPNRPCHPQCRWP